MDKELKIVPPEGYEVDKEHSTFECVRFKPIKPPLPTTWEEFCTTHPVKPEEAFIGSASSIIEIGDIAHGKRDFFTDRGVLPSKEYAEAVRSLCQLIQLRDCYNGGWKPDWHSATNKYCIHCNDNKITYTTSTHFHHVLAFKASDLRGKFYTNFIDLLIIAKLLL